MSSPESLLDRAAANFRIKANLSPSELRDLEATKCYEDVEQALRVIQEQQAKSKTLKGLKRLTPFLNTMNEYGKVMNVFVNASEMVAFVWVSYPTTFSQTQPLMLILVNRDLSNSFSW